MASRLADFYRDGGYLAMPVQKNAAYPAGGVDAAQFIANFAIGGNLSILQGIIDLF